MRALFFALLLSAPGLALAAEAACAADAEKYCKDFPAGTGARLSCLAQQPSRLEPACERVVKRLRGEASSGIEACRADAKKLCRGVAPGGGRLVACLQARRDDLSSACRERLVGDAERAEAVRAACVRELATTCAKASAGDGGKLACLLEHEAELGAACAKAVE